MLPKEKTDRSKVIGVTSLYQCKKGEVKMKWQERIERQGVIGALNEVICLIMRRCVTIIICDPTPLEGVLMSLFMYK